MPKDHKRKAPQRTYKLVLPAELEGYEVTMGAMSGRDIVNLRSGKLTEGEVLQTVASRMVSHNFDVADPLDLDYWILTAILQAWGSAMEEAALPPATGGR